MQVPKVAVGSVDTGKQCWGRACQTVGSTSWITARSGQTALRAYLVCTGGAAGAACTDAWEVT